MKKVIAIFYTIVLTASMLFNLFIIGNYCLQYKYYSEVLCVNKDKPLMHCNGTCHLKAELAQEETPDAPTLELREFKVNFTVSEKNTAQKQFYTLPIRNNFRSLFLFNPQDVILTILQPPQAIVLA